MELQVEALFESDGGGRLVAVRGPGGARPAPRFFFGRTRHGALWRFRADVPEPRVAELARLASREALDWPLDELPERFEAFRAALEADAPIAEVHHGPAYRFGETPTPAPDPEVVALTPDRAALLGPEWAELAASLRARQPCAAVVREGRAVSACYVARRSARAAEAGVRTLPPHRGRGLATRAVAAWAAAVAGAGLVPLYSTGWSNRASRAVAARLGLIPYGTDLALR